MVVLICISDNQWCGAHISTCLSGLGSLCDCGHWRGAGGRRDTEGLFVALEQGPIVLTVVVIETYEDDPWNAV